MSRRYLSLDEAKFAIKNGKEVEVFLGGFVKAEQKCIRWASFGLRDDEFVGKLWESIDEGADDFLDVYSFSSASGEFDKPVNETSSTELEIVVQKLGCSSKNLVNSGVVQDEYADYLSSC